MKTTKLKNVVLYALCTILAIFYIIVLYLASNPNVGIEYRMYYITNELTDWPGFGKLDYKLDTMEYCTGFWDKQGNRVNYNVCRRKGTGWDKYQSEGSFNSTNTSYIYYLPTESKDSAEFFVNILSFLGEKEVSVYANDKLIGTFAEKGEHKFLVEDVKEEELITIRFETEGSRFCLWQVALR